MHTPYIQRMVNLEPLDYRIVRRLAERKGLGSRGFSAALRLIIRDWSRLNAEAVRRAGDTPEADALIADLRDSSIA